MSNFQFTRCPLDGPKQSGASSSQRGPPEYTNNQSANTSKVNTRAIGSQQLSSSRLERMLGSNRVEALNRSAANRCGGLVVTRKFAK